jgi:hypothetical protein
VGEVPGAANCLCKDPLFIFGGKCAQQTLAKPTTQTQTRACNVGEVPGAANCLCKDPLFIFAGKCAQQTLAKPTNPINPKGDAAPRPCPAGTTGTQPNCVANPKVTREPPQPVVTTPPPPKPVVTTPPPPKPVVTTPPPPKPVVTTPPPPKPVVTAPPPPKPTGTLPCAPPKKLNPAGQCV